VSRRREVASGPALGGCGSRIWELGDGVDAERAAYSYVEVQPGGNRPHHADDKPPSSRSASTEATEETVAAIQRGVGGARDVPALRWQAQHGWPQSRWRGLSPTKRTSSVPVDISAVDAANGQSGNRDGPVLL